ncbi:MAG: 50S ribosomal protein L11 methyltransferase [Silicimonas sp.]|nr:50S ribosomal protein L11 methyltransferase [Silicimonas sp.]
MKTWTALTTLGDQSRAGGLGEALERLDPAPTGVGVFEVEDGSKTWEVGAYFVDRPDEIALALLAAAHGAAEFVISEVPDTDWVAHVRRELPPVEAGRFFVHGSHDAARVPDGSIALLIEAAMAFGTGHHGTTLGCLRALDRLVDQGFTARTVADIGCGTAVLGMAAARIWPAAEVIASDIDPVAVDVARVNLAANDLEGRVEALEAVGTDNAALSGPFDLVFANILKGPLLSLAPDIARVTAPDGVAILSGLLVTQADEIVAHYTHLGFNLEYRADIVEWTALTLRRNS